MAMKDERPVTAKILAGPGFTGRPEVLARALDGCLKDMVSGLEAVADCPSAAFDLPHEQSAAARMDRFCEALAHMGHQLLEGLASSYAGAAGEAGLDFGAHLLLWRERSGALIDYLEELARVHGVAFATTGAPPPPAAVEAALLSMRRSLEAMALDALAERQG